MAEDIYTTKKNIKVLIDANTDVDLEVNTHKKYENVMSLHQN
jgi:hypothetical protein